MKNFKFVIIQLGVIVSLSFFTSCKKYLTIPPPQNQLISSTVFENEATAVSAITGIYSEMMNNSQQFSSGYVTLFAGMAADELYFYAPGFRDEFLKNQLSAVNHDFLSSAFWGRAYQYIYAANLIIESLDRSKALSPATKKMLKAEAKFIRAFCYYYLTGLFGDVPLLTTSDYESNAAHPRTSQALIFEQMVEDLSGAVNDLPSAYVTAERIRPIKWAAAALLSRVYLHLGNWSEAEKYASDVISAGPYSLVTNLNQVFLKNSPEAIWQLQPVNPNYNTWEGNAVLGSGTGAPTYLVSSALLNSFAVGDKRKAAWIGSRVYAGSTVYYPYKYKAGTAGAPLTEYYMVLRLAEQYLVRAEARAEQNDLSGGLEDVNTLRRRAGLADTTTTDKTSLLGIVEKERRAELFLEWGHRWFDLKRTSRADEVLGALKPAWKPEAKLWPIPQIQMNLNSALTQNPGY